MHTLSLYYDWILFDADDTLFAFDAYRGLQLMFSRYGVKFTKKHYKTYQAINKALWLHYQNGLMSAKDLQCQRFRAWADRLNCAAAELNSAFLSAMADICQPLVGALSLLNALQHHVKLGIITNGFTELQQQRLERTGLQAHFAFIVISEQVGSAKPQPVIFDHALQLMGQPARQRVLMVGDNLETDILGGLNAGFITCWLNTHHKHPPKHITPHHQVTCLAELEQWLQNKK